MGGSGMRKMKIVVPRMRYSAGEEITGFIEIECDEPFDSKKTEVGLTGKIYAKGSKIESYSRGTKIRQRKVVKEHRDTFIEIQSTISDDRRFEIGRHRVEFSISLPKSNIIPGIHKIEIIPETYEIQEGGSLYPSYEGKNVWVKYSLHAKVELTRIKSIRGEIPIFVTIPFDWLRTAVEESPLGQRVVGSVMDGSTNIMDISTDSSIYCIDSPFQFKYRINTIKGVKEIKFELSESNLIVVEDTSSTHSVSLRSLSKKPKEHEPNEWQVLVLNPRQSACQTFTSDVLSLFHSFSATVEFPRSKKFYVEFPLFALQCPPNLKPTIIETGPKREKKGCPYCGAEIVIEGLIRPDGRVICPKCFKKFTPEK